MFRGINQAMLRFRARKDTALPNKCEICGLRVSYPSSMNDIDQKIQLANQLACYGLAVRAPRNINVSLGGDGRNDQTHFCALSRIKCWNKPHKKCPDWQLGISSQLTLSDHLAIHHTKNNTKIAVRLGLVAAALTLFGVGVGYV